MNGKRVHEYGPRADQDDHTTRLMPYSLWRNGKRLGEVVFVFDESDAGHIAGVFQPSEAFTDLAALLQTHMLHLPGAPLVLQTSAPTHHSGPAPIPALVSDAKIEEDPTRTLEMRDDLGDFVPTDQISLMRIPFPAIAEAGEWADVCRARGWSGWGWVLTARWFGAA